MKRQQAIEHEVWKFYSEHVACRTPPSFKDQVEYLEVFWPGKMAEIRAKPPEKKEPQPPQPPAQPPIPAPRKKVPIPAQPPAAPPVESPQKIPPAHSELTLPSSLGGRAVPVFENYLAALEEKILKKLKQRNVARRHRPDLYQELEEEIEKLEHQKELYCALRVKYAGWFLDDYVDSSGGETKIVLYNFDTGEDVLVEEYEDLANFFLSRGYVDFLSYDEFLKNWCHGKVKFPASKGGQERSELQEDWMLYTFIQDPRI